MSDVIPAAADPAAIAAEIDRQLQAARASLGAVAGSIRRLRAEAALAIAAAAEASAPPRVIRVRAKRPTGPNGEPIQRKVGRLKGGKNCTLTVWATPAQVAALRASLAAR